MKHWPSPWRAIPAGCEVCASACAAIAPQRPCSTPSALPALSNSFTPASWRTASADELIDKTGAQPHFFVMGAAKIDLGEDVLIAPYAGIGIDINHPAVDLEQRAHLLHILVDHQGMSLARRLIDITAFLCDPIKFQIAPAALDHIAMHRLRMTVARQDTGLAHTQQ